MRSIYEYIRHKRFYVIENLESDVLIGYNLLRKANVKLDFLEDVLVYNNEKEKIYIFENDSEDSENNIITWEEKPPKVPLKYYFSNLLRI